MLRLCVCELRRTNRQRTAETEVFVPELRALAFISEEDWERGRNFMRGCLVLKASRAENRNSTGLTCYFVWRRQKQHVQKR